MLLGGALYRLQLIETPRETITLARGRVVWPYISESGSCPNVDGVLCLYDVSDRSSLEGLPRLLDALDDTGMTTCLVTCKVDIPLCNHEVPAAFLDKVKDKFPSILLEEASIDSSDSAKRCLLKILSASLSAPGARLPERSKLDHNPASNFPPRTSSRNLSSSSSRSRSSSRHQPMLSKSRENLLTAPPSPVIESKGDDESEESSADETEPLARLPSRTPLRLDTRDVYPRPRVTQPQTPVSTTEMHARQLSSPAKHSVPAVLQTPDSLHGAMESNESTGRTFLNMDDESIYEEASPVEETADKSRRSTLEDDTPVEGAVTFADLVDRLLLMPTSKGDSKFIPSFLCLYRAFATPHRLLMALIDKFVKTEMGDLAPPAKTAELMRYLGVLGLWTTYYPGDFASNTVRDIATTFVSTIERNKSFAAAAKKIANNLQTVVPDDDDDWALADAVEAKRSSYNTNPQRLSSKDTKPRHRHAIKQDDDDDSDSDTNGPTSSSPRHSATTSSASSLARAFQVTSQTSDNLHNLETARENARKLRTVPHNPVSKVQWHQFMACSTDELAVEITRIDWTMYSAIRPRDFVRYVMVPNSQRVRPGQVDYIGMMTKHFNHLALFVAGMILLRDKPKHRAKMLEKFMDLAWKVRQMNNYHALGAIVAALNGEEIVRLSQTQELISNEQHKQFLRLKILMGHQKSHAAYRMAWDNSSAERIPFLPRVQEDLLKAAMGNSTFVGGYIKWSKFEVMGETIVGIQRSQEQPYNFPDRTARGHDINKLILETKVLEGDEVCKLVLR